MADVMHEHRNMHGFRASRPVDEVIAELAAGQHGVVVVRQLRDRGIGQDAIDWRVRRRRLVRLHRGVYAVGHDRLTRPGRWLAAVLACGAGAALSHRDGAAAWDVRACNRTRIDVTTPGHVRPRPGIDVHHTRALEPCDVTRTDAGIPITTIERTLIDLAEVVPASHLRRAINEADRRELLDFGALRHAMARTRGRHGHPLLDAVLEDLDVTDSTRSPLEDDFLALVNAAGLPRPQVNTIVEGIEVDACWPAARLVVELDGYEFHRGRRAFHDDHAKTRRLTLAGWTVLRYTHRDITRGSARAVAELRAAGAGEVRAAGGR